MDKLQKVEDKKFKIKNEIKKKEDDDSSSDEDENYFARDVEDIPPPCLDIYAKKIAYFT